MFLQFRNPIPAAIRDPKALSDLIKKYDIIPYYGDEQYTSHIMMSILADLADLSPSHIACKRDLKAYAFGGGLGAMKFGIPGVEMADDESAVDSNTKLQFFRRLQQVGLSPNVILETTKNLFDLSKDGGNAYLHIKEIKVGNTIKYQVTPWHFTQAGYLLKSSKSDLQHVVLTPYWDEEFWKKEKPLVLPVSYLGEPYTWKETSNIRETVLHIRNGNARTHIYGHPDLLSVMNALYAEYKTLELNAKISGTELVAKHLLAFEEPEPARIGRVKASDNNQATGPRGKVQSDFKMRIEALRDLTTNSGDNDKASGLAGIQYPKGGQVPTLINFNVNRDVQYASWTTENAASLIYSIHGWSKELTGQVSIKAGVGANMLYDLFLVKNVSTIKPLQSYYSSTVWGDIFSNILPEIGKQFEGLTIKFPDLITNMIIAFDNATNPLEQGRNPVQRDNNELSQV